MAPVPKYSSALGLVVIINLVSELGMWPSCTGRSWRYVHTIHETQNYKHGDNAKLHLTDTKSILKWAVLHYNKIKTVILTNLHDVQHPWSVSAQLVPAVIVNIVFPLWPCSVSHPPFINFTPPFKPSYSPVPRFISSLLLRLQISFVTWFFNQNIVCISHFTHDLEIKTKLLPFVPNRHIGWGHWMWDRPHS